MYAGIWVAPNVSSISCSMFKISLGICREGHDMTNVWDCQSELCVWHPEQAHGKYNWNIPNFEPWSHQCLDMLVTLNYTHLGTLESHQVAHHLAVAVSSSFQSLLPLEWLLWPGTGVVRGTWLTHQNRQVCQTWNPEGIHQAYYIAVTRMLLPNSTFIVYHYVGCPRGCLGHHDALSWRDCGHNCGDFTTGTADSQTGVV